MSIKHLYPTSTPALNLNPKSSRVADPRLSCVRNSIGTYVDPVSGLVKTAPVNVARVDKNGLLVEESRENLIEDSLITSANGWQAGTTLTPNNALAPDGTMTATTCLPLLNGQQTVTSPLRILPAAGIYTFSVFVQPTSVFTVFTLGVVNYADTANQSVIFDTTKTGINGDGITPNYQNNSNYLGATMDKSYPNGWVRLSITVNFVGPDLNGVMQVKNVNPSFGDGVNSFSLWQGQLEEGSFPTSIIPTSGSTVQRLADQITLTNSGIFNPNEFTTINEPFGVAGGSDTLTVVGDGSKAERTFVYNGYLTQEQTNAVAGTDEDWWEWRVLGSSFGLPGLYTDGQVSIDWGDGSAIETYAQSDSGGVTHTYTNGSGYHTIKFRLDSGTYIRPYVFNNTTHKDKVISVGPCPDSMTVNTFRGFYGCTNLKTFDSRLVHGGSLNMSTAWRECSSLLNIPFVDTSGTTDFSQICYNCTSLTSFPVIDTSSGTNFSYAWYNCTSLTSFPLIDTSSASTLEGAFNFSGLTSFPLLDTSGVTNFSYTWWACRGLTSFPEIDTSSGTNFFRTWLDCSGLTSFPELDFSSGTTFREAWRGTNVLTDFPANMFDITGTLDSDAFSNAWRASALTAQSIENILVSLDANGATGIALGINAGTNAAKTTWSTAANNAYNNLVTKSWSISFNP